jgi:4-hydroxy-3-methylbut-2-enyl diphosphate reductase IspH
VGKHEEVQAADWLPVGQPVRIGLTSGASTPDNMVGATVARLVELANGPDCA